MKIKERIVNSKKHTLGFILDDNQEYTRYETVRLAKQGYISGVKVSRIGGTYYVTGTNNSLYNLPEVVSTPHRMRSRRFY